MWKFWCIDQNYQLGPRVCVTIPAICCGMPVNIVDAGDMNREGILSSACSHMQTYTEIWKWWGPAKPGC